MPVKTLALIFENQDGDLVRMTLDNVKDDITDLEVKTVMQTIIGKNIFDTNGGNLAAISGAEVITRMVQELAVK